MKNILIIDAGLKPGWTRKTADAIMERLLASGACVCDRISLRDEPVAPCNGCALCLERSERACRHADDAAGRILGKMLWADGIVTVTPNYSLQVPAILKNVYDRLAFVFHRPRLFGKFSLAIVVQGVYGGNKIVDYIDEVMSFWGCSTVKGAAISGGLHPNSVLSATAISKRNTAIADAADRLIKAVQHPQARQPSFFRLAIFRMTRSSLRHSTEALAADKKYYSEQGWFESQYYSEVRLDPIRRLFGCLIDRMIQRTVRASQ